MIKQGNYSSVRLINFIFNCFLVKCFKFDRNFSVQLMINCRYSDDPRFSISFLRVSLLLSHLIFLHFELLLEQAPIFSQKYYSFNVSRPFFHFTFISFISFCYFSFISIVFISLSVAENGTAAHNYFPFSVQTLFSLRPFAKHFSFSTFSNSIIVALSFM